MLLYEPFAFLKDNLLLFGEVIFEGIKVNKSKETSEEALSIIQTRDDSGSE